MNQIAMEVIAMYAACKHTDACAERAAEDVHKCVANAMSLEQIDYSPFAGDRFYGYVKIYKEKQTVANKEWQQFVTTFRELLDPLHIEESDEFDDWYPSLAKLSEMVGDDNNNILKVLGFPPVWEFSKNNRMEI